MISAVRGASPPERFIRNFAGLAAGELAARAIAFVATVHLTRKLGPSGFGIWEFATAICGYFGLLVTSGFDSVGAKEIARRRSQAATIATGATLVRLMLACAALGLVAAVAAVLDKPPAARFVLVLTALSFLPAAADTSWVYKGLERTRLLAWSVVAGQSTYVMLILAVVHERRDISYVPLAFFLGQAVSALLLGRPLLERRISIESLREGTAIVLGSRFMLLSRFLRTLMFTFDLVLLGFLIGEREVGLYGAAYRVCFLALAIGVALHTSYLPAFSRGALLGTEEASRIARRAMEFASAMAAPLVVGGVLLADPLLRALFGAYYAEGAQALRVLLLSIGLIFLHGTFRNILLAYDRTGVETCIMAAAASINVALNFLLIPRFGLLGAAAATAAAEALVLALEAAAVRSLNVRLPWSATYRALCAALVMGLALSLMRDALHVAGSIALGALVYVVVLAMLGGIPADARQRLRFRTRRL